MKLEHRAIIERAKRERLMPAELASELLEHDLVQLVLDQLRGQSAPYGSLSEHAQQQTIERVTLGVADAVRTTIRIIASNGVKTVPVDVKRVQVDEKKWTVTAIVDGNDPLKHDLVDAAGHLCLLVMAPDDYDESLDGITPERDQKELALSASEIVAGMGMDREKDKALEELEKRDLEESKALLNEAQRQHEEQFSKEFGDYSYEEATRLLIVKAKSKAFKSAWVQSQLAISSDQVSTLLLRLLDDKMIVIEKEGESSTDHSYKVDKLVAE